jgi:undecaprenyl-diphosphatase
VTELVPVSSSAHLALVPRLLGWRYAGLAPEERKAFEVALHAGSAPALALVAASVRPAPRWALLPLTTLPAAAAGLLLERTIEQRLGGPRTVAIAQIGAGAALWVADRGAATRSAPDARDHLAVGIGQALALVPGVSRAGAALTAARLCGLDRPTAAALALHAALPVTAGAAVLKGIRLRRARERDNAALAVGAAGALAGGLAARDSYRRLAGSVSYTPLALYRVLFGVAAWCSARRS